MNVSSYGIEFTKQNPRNSIETKIKFSITLAKIWAQGLWVSDYLGKWRKNSIAESYGKVSRSAPSVMVGTLTGRYLRRRWSQNPIECVRSTRSFPRLGDDRMKLNWANFVVGFLDDVHVCFLNKSGPLVLCRSFIGILLVDVGETSWGLRRIVHINWIFIFIKECLKELDRPWFKL